MKLFYKSALFILFSITFIGCVASVAYRNEGVANYPPTEVSSIKIYSEHNLNKKVIELGYVSVDITDDANGDKLKEILKERASEIGADAIIDFRILGQTAEGIAVKFL